MFGTAKVGNVLRPFVYFNRPKATMRLDQFTDQNPQLGGGDNFNMNQRQGSQYELIYDMHELTKNIDAKGRETGIYIEYICAVINLYA